MRALVKRYLLIAAGILSLLLGILGAFLPLLPTVPLILLAGFCFARSSSRLHDWLLAHTTFGRIIRNYESGKGVPRKVKYRAILIIWLSMGISCWITGKAELCFMLVLIGVAVSAYLYRLPESANERSAMNKTDDAQD